MLTLTNVSKAFDGRPAVTDVTLSVAAGSRTAIVGVNGSGKSTLLRLAAGLLQPDTGTVSRAPGATVAYVPQDYGIVADMAVADYVKQRAGLLALERRLRSLERELDDPAQADAYADALEAYGALGGYAFEGRMARAMGDLGLAEEVLARRLGELSGGQQVRVGLAAILASRHAVYLMDEPTNNLDLPALDLLTDFVLRADATFLLVSHDRAFLEATATGVVELDEHRHTAEVYGLSFAEYLHARERALAARSARYRDYLAEVDRLQVAIRAQRGRAAQTRDRRPQRDNDRFASHFLTQGASRQAGKALRSLETRLARLEEPEQVRTGWELRLSLTPAGRGGDLVVEATGVELTRGSFHLGPVSVALHHGERVALSGPNGAGKSLLLALLTGATAPEAGAVRRGSGVVPGVLRQGGAGLAGAATGLEVFMGAVGGTAVDGRTLLAKFDLGADHVGRPVDTYSPGERCRLGLAILMARGANWLVLDEPTNHLDLEATEQLERALQTFDGTLLVVSHDRAFLDRVGLSRRLELQEGVLIADEPA